MKSTGPMGSVPVYFAGDVAGSKVPAASAVYTEFDDQLTPAASTEVTERATLAPGGAPLTRIVSEVSAAETAGVTASFKATAVAPAAVSAGEAKKQTTAANSKANQFFLHLMWFTHTG